MWPFPRRNRPKPPPMPNWVLGGIIVFLAIIMLINANNESPTKLSPLNQGIENVKSVLPDAEDYSKLLPKENTVEKEVLDSGTKAPLLCGQELTLKIQAYADGAPSGGAKTFQVRVGDKELSPFISDALQNNMSVGTKQLFTFREKQKLSSINPEAMLEALVDKVEFEVVDAKPNMASAFEGSDLNIQLFDTIVKSDAPAVCGDKVKLNIVLWDAIGKKIFANDAPKQAPIELVIGSNKIMLGIEQSLMGMSVGSARTIILPATWQIVGDTLSPADGIPAALRKPGKQLLVVSVLRVE